MKKSNLLLITALVITFLTNCNYVGQKYKTRTALDKNGYKYEYVSNDPIKTRIYTLKNGLKVYLSVNKDEPRVQTYIAVKAGSTYDPKETTGLAHYLEHMMFKGSSKIGTLNWEKEKKEIAKISDLFEQRKNTSDPEKKKALYAKIDSISTVAASYAVPNEYDKLVTNMGAKGTNAYTSDERTVYVNDIPANELDRWLYVESERFNELVLRLFHTELETVYEEFNMYQDNDGRKAWETLMANLFQKHPYGTQTTIGKAEHLKNPSMVNIINYWKTYYRPNNMAICLSGDLDMEKTIKDIDKYFGKFEANNSLPKHELPKEVPITKPVEKTVLGPNAEFMVMAYRFNGKNSDDEKYVSLIDMILANGTAGLIDLDLNQKQKVLNAGCSPEFMKDYGFHYFQGTPRQGQTLEQVRDLIIAEIEKVKNGQFDEWLIKANINNLRLSAIRSYESNSGRAHSYVEAFTLNEDWSDKLKFIDELEKINKQQLRDFAKKNYTNNYVIVFKKTGKDPNTVKVEKPQITPLNINRDTQSEFQKEFAKMKVEQLKPVFVDFDKEIIKEKLNDGIQLSYIQNKDNELFNLNYIIDMGKDNNKMLPIAVNYLPYLGTDKYTPEQLKQEFYKLGISMGVSTGSDRSYIYISGLEKNLDKGMELLEHVLAHAKPDQKIYNDYIDGIAKGRSDAKLDKSTILWSGLYNYGKYGKNSPFTNIYSMDELKKFNPATLTDLVKQIYNYKHQVFYYGQNDPKKVRDIVNKYHAVPAKLKDIPTLTLYNELPSEKSQVYLVNYDMVQSNIVMLSQDQMFNKQLLPPSKLFNEYFGGSMASIVFQEIREAKGLAYTAYATYSVPSKPDRHNYTFAYVGTQPDKLKTATEAMLALMNTMPKAQKNFDLAKEAIMKKIESERITKSNIFWTYQSNLDRGINYDYRKQVYEEVPKMNMDDLNRFFTKHISGKKYTYLVLANRDMVDRKVLEGLGEVKELTLEEIFNY